MTLMATAAFVTTAVCTAQTAKRTGSCLVFKLVVTAQLLRPRQHQATVTYLANLERLRHRGGGRGPAVNGTRRYCYCVLFERHHM